MKKVFLRVCSVITCIIVLIACCGVPVSASEVNQDLVDQGWIYNESNDSYYLPYDLSSEANIPSLMLLDEPKYPNFDPTLLPWYESPKEVQNIINMGFENVKVSGGSDYKMPFIAIRVNSSNVDVYVGINVILAASTTYTVRPIASSNFISDLTSFCYHAQFSHNYTVKSDWKVCTTYAWGDVHAYCSQTFISTDYNIDAYLYGGNGYFSLLGTGQYATRGKAIELNREFLFDNISGFFGPNSLLPGSSAAGEFPNVYITTFNPPSFEESQEKTQKGIWESIKALPSQIASSIKGFFTSLGDRISGFFTDLVNYMLSAFNALGDTIGGFFTDLFSGITEHFSSDDPGELDESKADELDDMESELFDSSSNYNPDDFKNDFKVNIDGKAVGAVFGMLDAVVQIDSDVYAGILMILVLGIIALIFNR